MVMAYEAQDEDKMNLEFSGIITAYSVIFL